MKVVIDEELNDIQKGISASMEHYLGIGYLHSINDNIDIKLKLGIGGFCVDILPEQSKDLDLDLNNGGVTYQTGISVSKCFLFRLNKNNFIYK
ncbi:MAG: hypothetical protein ACOCVF_03950 [bacterium]